MLTTSRLKTSRPLAFAAIAATLALTACAPTDEADSGTDATSEGIGAYVAAVKSGEYPADEHTFS